LQRPVKRGDPSRYVPEEKRLAGDLGPQSRQYDVNHGTDSSIELGSRRFLGEVTQFEEQLCDHPTEAMNHAVGVDRPEYALFLPGPHVGHDDVPGCVPPVEKLLVKLRSLQQHERSQP
jgi:hypothetical protein